MLCSIGDEEIVRVLFMARANIYYCYVLGDEEIVRVLFMAGANISYCYAIGDEEIVRVLFMARANASLTDIEERAPIHLAAERGYTKYVDTYSTVKGQCQAFSTHTYLGGYKQAKMIKIIFLDFTSIYITKKFLSLRVSLVFVRVN